MQRVFQSINYNSIKTHKHVPWGCNLFAKSTYVWKIQKCSIHNVLQVERHFDVAVYSVVKLLALCPFTVSRSPAAFPVQLNYCAVVAPQSRFLDPTSAVSLYNNKSHYSIFVAVIETRGDFQCNSNK